MLCGLGNGTRYSREIRIFNPERLFTMNDPSTKTGNPEAANNESVWLLPKLTRPRLHRAHQRGRLFRELNETLEHSAVWIGAGPGSGKTAIVSTWIESRKLPCLWYRVDSRDRDPGALFHYLRLGALRNAPRRAQDLPHLTLEYLASLDTYARNFFERFFACFKPGSILVFDNCQELGENSTTARLLATGLEQAPESMRIVLTSRRAPGAAFARLRASESLCVFDDAALALDANEASHIAHLRFGRRIAPERVEAIHRQTRGWAAGFTLLLEQTGTQGQMTAAVSGRLSQYFNAEVLSELDPATLGTLLQSAWLPRVPARLLNALCEDAQAAERVAALCRRNYFINETGGDETVYEYHPLLRDCLLQRARKEWPAARLDHVRQRAAQLLIAEDQYEDALDLLLELGDWQKVAGLIEKHAPVWLSKGREQIVESALAVMPECEIATRPWLIYWQANCRLPFNLVHARELFARAARLFNAAGDREGELFTCTAVLESYFHERGDFHPLDVWMRRIEGLLSENPHALENPTLEARLTAAMFSSFMARQPGSPALRPWITRAERLMMHIRDDLLKLGLAAHLVAYYAWWTGENARASAIVDAIEPAHKDARTNPLQHIVWSGAAAIHRWASLDFTGCIESAQRGLDIAAGSGIHLWDFLLLAQCSWGAIFAGDEAQAEGFLERMATALQPGQYLDASHYHFQRFILALRHNDAAAMNVQAEAIWQYAHSAGDPWAEGLGLVAVARARAANGDMGSARRLLRKAETRVDGEAGNTIAYAVLLARAELAFNATGTTVGLTELRKLMQFARRNNIIYSNWARDAVMAELCVRALEHGIEAEFVRRLVRLRHLVPREPPLHLDNWPWPLDIDTLGHFELRVDGVPLRFEGKSQKRPLALLKALIALGGHDVPETRLADALWPAAEGDAAQQALATTLHRLRRLISAEVVQRQQGMLSLDPARCRVDLWACERDLDRAESCVSDDAEGAHTALQSAWALYRGPFLNGVQEAWALPAREHLRNRLLRAFIVTADALHQRGNHASAVACYEHGLELDELAEQCYRGLMRCHLHSGRHAEGLAIYRRCTDALERALGVAPSADTEVLHRALVRSHQT